MQEIIEIYNLKIHNYPTHAVPGGIQFGDLEKSEDINGKIRKYNPDSPTFDTIDQTVKSDSILLTQDPLNSPHSRKNKYYKLYKNENAKFSRTQQNYKFDLVVRHRICSG